MACANYCATYSSETTAETSDTTTEKRAIDEKMRKIVYKSLELNVAVQATKPLLDYTFQCLGVEHKRIPCASTISRFAYELGALAGTKTYNHTCNLNTIYL